MATVYLNFINYSKNCQSLPKELYEPQFEVECLKVRAPDDGEALGTESRYRIDCPDHAWREVLEILRDTERSLIYTVVMTGANGDLAVREAGEINSTVRHYTTRLNDAKEIFAFWFDDCLPSQRPVIAA